MSFRLGRQIAGHVYVLQDYCIWKDVSLESLKAGTIRGSLDTFDKVYNGGADRDRTDPSVSM